MNKNLKIVFPHLAAIFVFLIVSYIYFFPALEGKVLHGTDNITAKSMSGEVGPFTELTGEYCAWTNAAFGGMPAYTVWTKKDAPLRIVTKVINFFTSGGPISYLFIAMIAFYILLISYGVNPWLSIAGSLAYAFSSSYISIIGAGHVTKVLGLAYMPGVIAGIYLVYKKEKLLLGSTIMAIFLAMEIGPGHYQIIYYTILIVVAMGINFFIIALRNKTLPYFFKSTGILVIAALLAGLTTISSIWATQEYTPFSARGKSVLTSNENLANPISNNGLDFEYATQWSYGIAESFNLLIPNFRGGSSSGSLSENSEIYKLFSQRNPAQAKQIIKQLPLYWGPQPFTEGPTYLGALSLFLFVFAMFFLKTREKWWILIISVFALLLAWGNHFETFNRLIFNYLPLYDKFRAVSTTLVIAQLTVPLLGIVALNQIFKEYNKSDFVNALKWALGILGGITLLFVLFPGLAGNFSGPGDSSYSGNQPFLDALMADRKSILRADALRSLFFIISGAVILWLANIHKLNIKFTGIAVAVLVLLDLTIVDKRFVSFDDFKTVRATKSTFTPSTADISIYDMEMQNPAIKGKANNFLTTYKNKAVVINHESPDLLSLNLTTDYRVLNLSGGINFSDALTSYYHKSLSGYSPAKLRRYQDLIDRGVLVQQIQNFAKNFQSGENSDSYNLLNMLNTKYIILKAEQPAFKNDAALGNAWFVKSVKWVNSADEEFDSITKIKPRDEAVVHIEFKDHELENMEYDSTATINLTNYKPHILTYESKTRSNTLAVFSEMYYPKGWNVYVDGKLTEYLRANYLFRALPVTAGTHTIEFRFEPRSYLLGNKINMIASLILIGLILFLLGMYIRKVLGAK